MRLKKSSAEAAIQGANPKPNAFRQFLAQWDLQLLVLPGIILLFIFSYLPIYGVVMAFQEYKIGDVVGASQWVGFRWFIELFKTHHPQHAGHQYPEPDHRLCDADHFRHLP